MEAAFAAEQQPGPGVLAAADRLPHPGRDHSLALDPVRPSPTSPSALCSRNQSASLFPDESCRRSGGSLPAHVDLSGIHRQSQVNAMLRLLRLDPSREH